MGGRGHKVTIHDGSSAYQCFCRFLENHGLPWELSESGINGSLSTWHGVLINNNKFCFIFDIRKITSGLTITYCVSGCAYAVRWACVSLSEWGLSLADGFLCYNWLGESWLCGWLVRFGLSLNMMMLDGLFWFRLMEQLGLVVVLLRLLRLLRLGLWGLLRVLGLMELLLLLLWGWLVIVLLEWVGLGVWLVIIGSRLVPWNRIWFWIVCGFSILAFYPLRVWCPDKCLLRGFCSRNW